MGWPCGTYGREEVYTGCRGNLKERDHLEDQGIDGKIILTRILVKLNVRA